MISTMFWKQLPHRDTPAPQASDLGVSFWSFMGGDPLVCLLWKANASPTRGHAGSRRKPGCTTPTG